ncbi:MAG: 4-hydroxy-tetrahydrodipicolinate reductase [Gammaproteobacteria bacterium]|nr:4-hydroxy-tetrahydrodipicolinate reductase [Chromatiales bacterium]MCP4925443.1 4-hydroxy-tetrahydrodipicolinate reductase [Gammaproteobacteria bacterium]MDP7296758.1 4-hydroxy-tetrahydrodipicolinate reductase [Gammaproteobacteria bacterium]MDP7419608.1 4-hydroxy-tetrahydrodipicolinate reductase [Gammaproteobacteria bacterium]MDP7660955.1 4-hydroxy-tetrahydrodipicolinate reductase [Gammaproteobacteria bacterium]
MTRIAIFGATGRMGQTLIRLITDDADLELVGAATEPGHADIGSDAGSTAGVRSLGVVITDDTSAAVSNADVAIDFTLPAAAQSNLASCVEHGVALVMGTTGLSADDDAALKGAAGSIAVLYGRNMSVGVNLLSELARLAGKSLGTEYDIEIKEAHHRNKVDAPSGTALQLGESVAQGRGLALDSVAVYERHGIGESRTPGSIGFSSVRAGNIVGDHTVLFAADEEIIELRHRALDRAVFARGALRAATWIAGRQAGFYTMNNVLEL